MTGSDGCRATGYTNFAVVSSLSLSLYVSEGSSFSAPGPRNWAPAHHLLKLAERHNRTTGQRRHDCSSDEESEGVWAEGEQREPWVSGGRSGPEQGGTRRNGVCCTAQVTDLKPAQRSLFTSFCLDWKSGTYIYGWDHSGQLRTFLILSERQESR